MIGGSMSSRLESRSIVRAKLPPLMDVPTRVVMMRSYVVSHSSSARSRWTACSVRQSSISNRVDWSRRIVRSARGVFGPTMTPLRFICGPASSVLSSKLIACHWSARASCERRPFRPIRSTNTAVGPVAASSQAGLALRHVNHRLPARTDDFALAVGVVERGGNASLCVSRSWAGPEPPGAAVHVAGRFGVPVGLAARAPLTYERERTGLRYHQHRARRIPPSVRSH